MGAQNLSAKPALKLLAECLGPRMSRMCFSCTDIDDDILLNHFLKHECTDNVVELDLSGNQIISNETHKKFFAHFGNLEYVQLGSTLVADDAFALLLKNNPKIRNLQMDCQSAGMLPRRMFFSLSPHNQFLQKIGGFDSTEAFDDVSVTQIAKCCPNLRILLLEFGDCTDKSLFALAENCKKLRRLNISNQKRQKPGNRVITLDGIMTLIKSCPYLMELDYGEQGDVDDEDKEDEEDEKGDASSKTPLFSKEVLKLIQEINPNLEVFVD